MIEDGKGGKGREGRVMKGGGRERGKGREGVEGKETLDGGSLLTAKR